MKIIRHTHRLAFYLLVGATNVIPAAENGVSDVSVRDEIIIGIGGSEYSHQYRIEVPRDVNADIEGLRFDDARSEAEWPTQTLAFWEWAAERKPLAARLISVLSSGLKGSREGASDSRVHIANIAMSPDSRLIALAVKTDDDRSGARKMVIVEASSMTVVFSRSLASGRYIAAFSWNPASSSVVILEGVMHIAKEPFSLLKAFSGHPVSVNKFFMALISVPEQTLKETSSPFAGHCEMHTVSLGGISTCRLRKPRTSGHSRRNGSGHMY